MSRPASFIARVGEDVTLQTRSLVGARDTTTKWPPTSYTETTIKAIVRPESSRQVDIGGVRETSEQMELFTDSVITIWSRIVYNGVTYTIVTEPVPHRKRGTTLFYTAALERVP